MLFRTRLSSLKHSALVSIISAVVFLAGTAQPGFKAVAEEAQQSAAPAENTSADAPALLSANELVELVGPIALYPDELLSITLPAATSPLEVVQAARYLEKHKSNPDLKPDEKWDASILGLLNYPEVIDLLNKDLDWTWKLGSAVADQQSDVMDAIQQFRNQAHTAGNLETNDNQVIVVEKEVIVIESATPEVIYVPTYNPSTVVVYQTAPYPYYYSAPYPYYYNPHAAFWTGMFIGAAISYGVGWGRYGRGGDININRGGNTVNIGSGNRPGGGNRPGAGNRPNRPGAGNRPNRPNRPGAGGRPGGGNRPGAGGRPGGGNRPGAGTRPSTRPSTGSRPSAGTRPSTRPSTGQRPSSMDRSRSRPSAGQSRSRTGSRGSMGGYKSGRSASRNSQRGRSSRSSQSRSRSSSSRSRGGGRSASRGGGRSRGGGGGRGGGGRRR